MFKGKPILAGNSDLNQAQLIFNLVGSPTEENMPGWSLLPGCEGVKNFGSRPGNLSQVFKEYVSFFKTLPCCILTYYSQGPAAISLLTEFLKLDWRKRINAIDALKHPYFLSPPPPAKPGELPRFEDSHEFDRRKLRGQRAAPPPAPAGGTVGMNPNGEWTTDSASRTGLAYRGIRVPAVAHNANINSVPSNKSGQIPDTRIPAIHPTQEKVEIDDSRQRFTAGQKDGGLLPRPLSPCHHPSARIQDWRSDSRRDTRRGRIHQLKTGGRPDGKLDSYIPDYNSQGDQFRARDDDTSRHEFNRRDDKLGLSQTRRSHIRDRDRDPRSRSRSPSSRDWERDEDSSYNLYRR
jgi:serine/threonine-protein kinase BUR1